MAGEEPVAAGSGASGTSTTVSDKGSDGPSNEADGAGTRVRAAPQHDAVQAVVGVALIMLGCGANNFFLELIVRYGYTHACYEAKVACLCEACALPRVRQHFWRWRPIVTCVLT